MIPKAKRRQVFLAALGALGVLAILWFGLVNQQNKNLDSLASQIKATQARIDTVRKVLGSARQLEEELNEATAMLDAIEEKMATGDYYSWVINTIRQFKTAYQVDIPQFSTIVGPGDVKMLPLFPYKQVALTIGGTGYYHEIGRFVAEYENQFPHSWLQNLELEPAPVLAGVDKEKIAFRVEVVTLVKPGNP